VPRMHWDLVVAQINTKRHWPFAVKRVLRMHRKAAHNGADIITYNEINKEQAYAINALPGWDVFWVINDKLRNDSWSGNAIAYRVSSVKLVKAWAKTTEIDYRRGRKRDKQMGPWFKKSISQACIRLSDKDAFPQPIDIQAFHNPTRFNSNEESRQACAADTKRFVSIRTERNQPVVASGDGNNIFGTAPGAPVVFRDGPDGIITNGKVISRWVLPFKLMLLSDHNGIMVKLRFLASH
jgi:hypothetical protein